MGSPFFARQLLSVFAIPFCKDDCISADKTGEKEEIMEDKSDNNKRIYMSGKIHTMEAFAELMKALYLAAHPEKQAEVVGNSGRTVTGIAFLDGDTVIPMVRLDGFYQKYAGGQWSLMQAFDRLEAACIRYDDRQVAFVGMVTDYGFIKSHICYKLVHPERNKEFLGNAPFIPWLDLVIVFYIPLEVKDGSWLSFPIDNALMEEWGSRM